MLNSKKWPMTGLKIPPIDHLRLLLFKILKQKNFTGGNRGNGGASRCLILGSFEGLKTWSMTRLKIPPIDPLRLLLFKI
jgi:hypothetical protein